MHHNTIYNIDNREGLAKLEQKCANLIIADPPYFECKGEFDFVWKSFDEYLAFMEEQAKLYKRVLADNGTLFVYGHAKRIAYVQVIFDKYFKLENNITWKKIDSLMYEKGSSGFRCFLPNNERLLMYSNEVKMTGLEMLMKNNIKPIHPMGRYLQSEFDRAQVSNRDLAKLFPSRNGNLTGCVSNWINGDNFIAKDQYEKIRDFLGDGFLRQEYETLRRPFNNIMRLSDVMEFSQEAHITGKYDHETQKPEKLTRALIVTCSHENDLVVVPFIGSGTECAMAVRENRRFVGFETNPKHCETARARVKKELMARQQEGLFAENKNGKAKIVLKQAALEI